MDHLAMDSQPKNPFLGKRVAVIGKLVGMTHGEAGELIRRLGGTFLRGDAHEIDLLLHPDEAQPPSEKERLSETDLWTQLGVLETGPDVRRLYTPAVLARLIDVPTADVRRWLRLGLLQPARRVHRLAYFDFEEITAAKRVRDLTRSGISAEVLAKRLADLARCLPDVQRPLLACSFTLDGSRLLVRHGERLIEASGQRNFDFEADPGDSTLPFHAPMENRPPSREQLLSDAADAEDQGDFAAAAQSYRTVLGLSGLDAEVCFQLAECLYRLGDLTAARERYSVALELEETFVEARLNLGCVLAELGQNDLAVAAWEGTLSLDPDFADAYYHLARLHETTGRLDAARGYWRRFLEIAPESPWRDEAKERARSESQHTLGNW